MTTPPNTAVKAARADAGKLHQAPAALVLLGGLDNGQAVFLDTFIESVSVYEQVANTAVGPAGECFKVGTDFPAQAFDFLWQDNAELADQAAQAVIERGAPFNKTLPGAVQAEDGLLIDVFHGYVTASQMAAALAASFLPLIR